MPAQLLDGKIMSQQIRGELAGEVVAFRESSGIVPTLAVALVGEHPASESYVRSKQRGCEQLGMTSQLHRLPATASQTELLTLIGRLNDDPAVHGILVQLPLPSQIDELAVLDAVAPHKDVDCFHPENVGLLLQGRPRFLPCTPYGVQQMLHRGGVPVEGKHVVVVGRSDIVGKPLAAMLAQRNSPLGPSAANATVTICHSRTHDLAVVTRTADVLVAAIGRPKFITADMVRPGAAVVDVGINRTDEGLVGDVDFAPVREIASHISPVPGGVGLLTVTMLLANTLAAAKACSG